MADEILRARRVLARSAIRNTETQRGERTFVSRAALSRPAQPPGSSSAPVNSCRAEGPASPRPSRSAADEQHRAACFARDAQREGTEKAPSVGRALKSEYDHVVLFGSRDDRVRSVP